MIRSEHISTSKCEKHRPKVKSYPDSPPSDSSDSSSSDSAPKRKKSKNKKKRRKHRKDDSSDLSSSDDSDDSDSSEDSNYRRRRRKNKKHRKKDPIRLCANLTAKLLTTAYESNGSKSIRQEKKKARAVGISSNRNLERLPRKYYRCGSEDHMIAKCPKPPKDNKKRREQVRFNEEGNRACDNGEDNDDHKMYAYMS